MTNNNIEMTTTFNIKKQEEPQMTKNIKLAKDRITEELTSVMEKLVLIEMENYDKIKELTEMKGAIIDHLEKVYEIRTDLGVTEEELGREIDERRTSLYKTSFNIDRDLKKAIEKEAEEAKEAEEIKNKLEEMSEEDREGNIEKAKKLILEELSYITESCYYMEERYYNKLSNLRIEEQDNDKISYLKNLKEILENGIEKIYDIRIDLGVTEEELGREIDERRAKLYKLTFDTERKLEEIGAYAPEAC